MIPFEEIDLRLDALGKDRKWLSEVTGRSSGAIRAALAPNSAPKNRTQLLQKALSDAIEKEEELRREHPAMPDRITIEAPTEEAIEWNRLAAKEGIPVHEWAVIQLNKAAQAWANSTPGNVRNFPVRSHLLAAAGSPITAEVTDWDGADDTVMVRISGLSMVPLLNDGEVIAMKHKRASRNPFMKKGLIYLVEYDGGYTVKRYNTRPPTPEEKGEEWVEKGKVKVLESLNPAFTEIVIKQPIEWIAWLEQS